MADDDFLRLSCTEQGFKDAFREHGFLSPYVEEAVPAYVRRTHPIADAVELVVKM